MPNVKVRARSRRAKSERGKGGSRWPPCLGAPAYRRQAQRGSRKKSVIESSCYFLTLTFRIWSLTLLTLSGSFYLETRNELFQFFPAAFRTLRLPSIVLSDAEHGSKFLFTFRASVVVAGHPLSLLSHKNKLILI